MQEDARDVVKLALPVVALLLIRGPKGDVQVPEEDVATRKTLSRTLDPYQALCLTNLKQQRIVYGQWLILKVSRTLSKAIPTLS